MFQHSARWQHNHPSLLQPHHPRHQNNTSNGASGTPENGTCSGAWLAPEWRLQWCLNGTQNRHLHRHLNSAWMALGIGVCSPFDQHHYQLAMEPSATHARTAPRSVFQAACITSGWTPLLPLFLAPNPPSLVQVRPWLNWGNDSGDWMHQIDSASPHNQHYASAAKQPGSAPGKLCMIHSHNGLLNTHQIASLALIMVTFGNGCRKVVGQRLSLEIIGEIDPQVWQMGSFKNILYNYILHP